jgi:hypothetical protein
VRLWATTQAEGVAVMDAEIAAMTMNIVTAAATKHVFVC